MPRAERDRNGSEPEVPNHLAESNGGRPPVVSDDDLLKLATRLNRQLGRPPKAAELIEAAGGCQKKRALDAIQELKLDIARAAVRSELMFPRAIELSLRGLMAEWLEHASVQLAARHQAEADQSVLALERSTALIDEQRSVISQLREAVADRERASAELTHRVTSLSADLVQVREDKIRVEAIATERESLIRTISVRSGGEGSPSKNRQRA